MMNGSRKKAWHITWVPWNYFKKWFMSKNLVDNIQCNPWSPCWCPPQRLQFFSFHIYYFTYKFWSLTLTNRNRVKASNKKIQRIVGHRGSANKFLNIYFCYLLNPFHKNNNWLFCLSLTQPQFFGNPPVMNCNFISTYPPPWTNN